MLFRPVLVGALVLTLKGTRVCLVTSVVGGVQAPAGGSPHSTARKRRLRNQGPEAGGASSETEPAPAWLPAALAQRPEGGLNFPWKRRGWWPHREAAPPWLPWVLGDRPRGSEPRCTDQSPAPQAGQSIQPRTPCPLGGQGWRGSAGQRGAVRCWGLGPAALAGGGVGERWAAYPAVWVRHWGASSRLEAWALGVPGPRFCPVRGAPLAP